MPSSRKGRLSPSEKAALRACRKHGRLEQNDKGLFAPPGAPASWKSGFYRQTITSLIQRGLLKLDGWQAAILVPPPEET